MKKGFYFGVRKTGSQVGTPMERNSTGVREGMSKSTGKPWHHIGGELHFGTMASCAKCSGN